MSFAEATEIGPRKAYSLASSLSSTDASIGSRNSQFISASAQTAPSNCAAMKPGRSIGRMPEKVLVSDRAIATAGFANDEKRTTNRGFLQTTNSA